MNDIETWGTVLTLLGLAMSVTSLTLTYVVPKVNGGSTPHMAKTMRTCADFGGPILTLFGLSLLGWWYSTVLAIGSSVLFAVLLIILTAPFLPFLNTPRGKRNTEVTAEAATDPQRETPA